MTPNKRSQKYPVMQPVSVSVFSWGKIACVKEGGIQTEGLSAGSYQHFDILLVTLIHVCAATPQCLCLASFELFCSSLLLPVLRQPGLCIFKTHYVSLALG